MASFNKVNDFILNAVQNMDLESDQIKIALSNTAPGSESSDPSADGNGVLANVTEVSIRIAALATSQRHRRRRQAAFISLSSPT